MRVAGGCQVKETELGLKDVTWRLEGAWTAGLAAKE